MKPFRARRILILGLALCLTDAPGLEPKIRSAYLSLAHRFNQDLAGRFPFGSRDKPDASAAGTCAFLRDKAPSVPFLEEALRQERDSVPGLDPAIWFLANIREAAQYLEHYCTAAGRTARVTFLALPERSRGAEQLTNWTMRGRTQRASYPNGFTSFAWNSSDPLVLEWTWAAHSPWRPLSSSRRAWGNATATFSFPGPWAWLRLMNDDAFQSYDSTGALMRFRIPVFQKTDTSRVAHIDTLWARLRLEFQVPATAAFKESGRPKEFPRQAPWLP
ncbi:MAG: type secretion protein IcmF [Fibrobacteria bacterium]|nr:type secretion protein IcmF [Fibrobacteria bacterium]